MAQLSTKISLYCKAKGKSDIDFTKDVLLQDDMEGGVSKPYIKEWNVSGVDKPSDSDLASYETAVNTEEKNNTVRATRKAAYGDIGDQLDEIYKSFDDWKARIKSVKDANPKS